MTAPLARPIREALAQRAGIAGPLAEALAIERRPGREIEALVAGKLARLVRHAADTSPGWSARFDRAGIDASRVRTIADLAGLPVLTKDDLRHDGTSLLAGGAPDPAWIRNASGGSTGAPVTFWQDRDYQRRMLADQARHVTWTGLPWWTPRAFVWGADRDSVAHTSARGRFKDALEGTLFLNTFRADDDDYRAFARRCAVANVPLVIGYAGSLEHFARITAALRDTGDASVRAWRPHAVQSSAERLSPVMRRTVEAGLGAPVFDRYGSREMGNAAHECESHTGLHVSMERVIVEIVRGGTVVADGEEGELVVSVLDNFAQPLLRYATGDLGRKVTGPPCACGRAYERLEVTAGRSSDLFTAPSGRRVHGEYFTHLFYGKDAIAAFRLTQETRARIVMELVRGPGDADAAVRDVLAGISEMDPAFEVETRWVDAIEGSESGKRRFTVSKVPVEW